MSKRCSGGDAPASAARTPFNAIGFAPPLSARTPIQRASLSARSTFLVSLAASAFTRRVMPSGKPDSLPLLTREASNGEAQRSRMKNIVQLESGIVATAASARSGVTVAPARSVVNAQRRRRMRSAPVSAVKAVIIFREARRSLFYASAREESQFSGSPFLPSGAAS